MANGKVDRAALPAPEPTRPEPTGGFVAPVTPTEQVLADLWAEVLDLDQVGVGDNFFDIGGHSLLVTRAVARARTMGLELSVTDVYDAPTIAALAPRVRLDAGVSREPRAAIAIRRGTVAPAVFCVHEVAGGASDFHELAGWLDPGQQLFGLQARGLFDDAPPRTTVEDMATAYVDAALEVQPDGPYLFAGLSMGCFVALEMAREAVARGKQVAAVVMLGAPTPESARRGGKSVDDDMRKLLLTSSEEAIAGPPGARLPDAVASWFSSEWTMSEAELDRLRAGDKDMLRMVRVVEVNRRASVAYQANLVRPGRRLRARRRPVPFDGRVVLFLPEQADEGTNEEAVARWRAVLPREPEVRLAPGNHYSIIKARGAEVMGAYLAAEVARLAR